MTRQPLIAGNWKMNKTLPESVAFTRDVVTALAAHPITVDVVVAPTLLAVHAVAQAAEGTPIQVAGQNVHPSESGAFTGEVSAPMLKAAGCNYGIIGHSERRQMFGDTDEFVQQKLRALLNHSLKPIVCLGETLEEREKNQTKERVSSQLSIACQNLTAEEAARVTVAYEPIWAIGTGLTASPEQAQEIHALLRQQLVESFGKNVANTMRILYGGSVKPSNIESLIQQPDIDGALIGGASLKVDLFTDIILTAQQFNEQS